MHFNDQTMAVDCHNVLVRSIYLLMMSYNGRVIRKCLNQYFMLNTIFRHFDDFFTFLCHHL